MPVVGGAAPAETIEAPVRIDEPDLEEGVGTDRPWIVIVWNDPVNLMSYVVLRVPEAVRLLAREGDEADARGAPRGQVGRVARHAEKAEIDVARLHAHGLWATMEHDSS